MQRSGDTSAIYTRIDDTRVDDLVAFLTAERWEFFGTPDVTEGLARTSWDNGDYRLPDCEGFFIEDVSGTVMGLLRLFDLEDDNVLFDIRLAERARGQGLGTQSVRWLASYLFSHDHVVRIDANTRQDNRVMRVTLRRCGFVKEGHHRSNRVDAPDGVTYALLRRDWELGTTTPVPWDDAPDIDSPS